LVTINFADNKLSAIPDEIGYISTLEEIDLQNNNLTTIPETLKKLKNLTYIDLSGSNSFSKDERKRIEKIFSDVFVSLPDEE
jgi:Leucine-rich repeat (LRR) protein